jgi:hypothetical protein
MFSSSLHETNLIKEIAMTHGPPIVPSKETQFFESVESVFASSNFGLGATV